MISYVVSIPIYDKDIILVATDGLFDNIFLPEIVNLVSMWEQEFYGDSINSSSSKSSDGIEKTPVQILADRLTWKAREFAIDTKRDSPFALLAKDNDILWSLGGKPDDTVVVVTRISSA